MQHAQTRNTQMYACVREGMSSSLVETHTAAACCFLFCVGSPACARGRRAARRGAWRERGAAAAKAKAKAERKERASACALRRAVIALPADAHMQGRVSTTTRVHATRSLRRCTPTRARTRTHARNPKHTHTTRDHPGAAARHSLPHATRHATRLCGRLDGVVALLQQPVPRVGAHSLGLAGIQVVHALLNAAHDRHRGRDDHQRRQRLPRHGARLGRGAARRQRRARRGMCESLCPSKLYVPIKP
jgi:hypothetical protein